MTDEQIEKGFELCINDGIRDCDNCPYNYDSEDDNIEEFCITKLQKDCLAYINRLKAEKATLIKEADDNAALAMEQKLRADKLEAKQSLLLEETEKRVRQETAKEVLQELEKQLWDDIDLCSDFTGREHNHTVRQLMNVIKRKYGVEVEE